jgi:hypothetical protein
MDEQSKSSFDVDLFHFTFFIAMIASIKFDVGFKIHLAEMGIFNFHLALQHLYCCHFKIILVL